MMNIEKTIVALRKKFDEAEYSIVELTMKVNNDKVEVEEFGNFYEAYFESIGKVETYKTIEELAKMLCEYPKAVNKLIDEDREYFEENEPKLIKFYNEHIKGHTEEELMLGNDICSLIYDVYKKLPEEIRNGARYIFDESLDDYYIDAYLEKHQGYSRDDLKNAYKLSIAFDSYSDWHKDVYGYRPRNL